MFHSDVGCTVFVTPQYNNKTLTQPDLTNINTPNIRNSSGHFNTACDEVEDVCERCPGPQEWTHLHFSFPVFFDVTQTGSTWHTVIFFFSLHLWRSVWILPEAKTNQFASEGLKPHFSPLIPFIRGVLLSLCYLVNSRAKEHTAGWFRHKST